MKVLVEIEGLSQPVLADVDARDRRAFERNGIKDLGIAQRLPIREVTAANPESYTTWLCWHSLVRIGYTAERFADFEKKVISIQPEESEEELDSDPTGLATLGG